MTRKHIENLIAHLKATHDYPPHFSPDEFKCHCNYDDCPKFGIRIELVWRLSLVRILSGIPMVINSGWRCQKHNADIHGEPDSAHLTGWAADIKATTSTGKFEILEAAIEAGFDRVGVYSWGLHLDIAPFKVPRLLWHGVD